MKNGYRISLSDWCRQNGREVLLRQWDDAANEIGPEDIGACSRKPCFWRCLDHPEHRWAEPPERRTHHKSQECPFCSGRFPSGSVNSLAAKYPEIAKLFDAEKNKLPPEEVFPKTNLKYWWRCSRGHSWQATPNAQTSGDGRCPYCARRRASPEYNLATEFPMIAAEWLYEKNDGVPSDYLPHSEKMAAWRCRCHPDTEWRSAICSRTASRLSSCPVCRKERGTSFPEQAVYYYLKLLFADAENRSRIGGTEVDIYLPSLKLAIEYDGSYYHSGAGRQEREEGRDRALREAGLSVLHIKEAPPGQAMPECDAVLWCPISGYGNYLFLEDLMRALVLWINGRYGLHLVTRPDISRDSAEIQSSYMSWRKENSLAQKAPGLAREWHAERNGLFTPAMVSYGSGKKVWWRCEKGHEWQATVSARYRGGKCPYCSGKRVCRENSLAYRYPKLAKQLWHGEKNAPLTPSDVTAGSNRRAWWRCEKGHEWEMRVCELAKGYRCPYCSGHRVTPDNALAVRRPELAAEWHLGKNGEMTPADIAFSSGKTVWWQCEQGHEWQERVANRSQLGYGCPYCSGKRPTEGNNLAALYPALMLEWDAGKNQGVDPAKLLPRSNRKAWWVCGQGHEWEARIYSRTSGSGCPYCAGKRVGEENCLERRYPQAARRWHPVKNGALTPRDVAPHSAKEAWWMCGQGHEWRRKICYEIDAAGCPYCGGRLAGRENSLAACFPALAKEWDSEKNGALAPHDVTPKSKWRVWWKCDRGHSWQMDIRTRCGGRGACPFCAGRRVCEENSLEALSPQVAAEWDFEKNPALTPAQVTTRSSVKVWWKCAKGHSWQAQIRSRAVQGSGCPVCAGKAAAPDYNLATEYPELTLDWDLEKNGVPPEAYLPYSNKEVWWRCRRCGTGWRSGVVRRTRENNRCPQCGGL